MPYAAAGSGFDYRPPAAHDKGPLAASEIPATFRYPAAEYQVDQLTPALLAPPSLDDGVRSELC